MSWVVVIPKEGRARVAVPTLYLVWHRLFTKKKSNNFFFKIRPCAPVLLLIWQWLRLLVIFLAWCSPYVIAPTAPIACTAPVPPTAPAHTVVCLIEVPGATARSNLMPCSKIWGSELSNAGFGLKIGQLLRKIGLFQSLRTILGPLNYGGASIKRGAYNRQNTVISFGTSKNAGRICR